MEIIQEYGTIFMILAIVFGLYMCWGIGANDVANAMGTSVGSGAITVKQAIFIAAVFEFAGAFIAGGQVTKTIRKGIIDPSSIAGNPELLVYGMLASLLAAAIWLMIASTRGWPVSTTHSIVGAIVGFAVVGIGMEAVQWAKIGKVAASWIVSPIVGGTIAFLLMISIRKLILNTENPFKKAQQWGPVYIFMVGFITALVTLWKGLKHLKLDFTMFESFVVSTIIGVLVALLGKSMINKVQVDEEADKEYHFASVEKVFMPMMIFTACAMAFAHGSNDVANGIGPLAAVVSIVQSNGEVVQKAGLPIWILLLGGGGIVVGLATMGYKVMQTIGTKITELTPTRGYSATLASAVTVVLASKTGMPVSTTQIAVGAVMGVGFARGIGALDLRVVGGIFVSWLVTLPAGGLLAAGIYFMLKGIFGTGPL
uniref:Phosphate transporter n=1 Tax=Magnetococcus massalia (strain MO-1) TaxID=451514 RepID=A0A1S7LJ70_MAGMO|nr:putative phosphate permease [Candidatus Magnetococcus massalia]